MGTLILRPTADVTGMDGSWLDDLGAATLFDNYISFTKSNADGSSDGRLQLADHTTETEVITQVDFYARAKKTNVTGTPTMSLLLGWYDYAVRGYARGSPTGGTLGTSFSELYRTYTEFSAGVPWTWDKLDDICIILYGDIQAASGKEGIITVSQAWAVVTFEDAVTDSYCGRGVGRGIGRGVFR
jgi:hypothetical protein